MFLFGPPNIEKMEAKKDLKGLIKVLGYQKDYNIRKKAAFALGKLGDARAVEPLIKALGDKYELVREAAAVALGHLGDTRAVEPLIRALQDENVCMCAAFALGKLGDVHAVEPLIEVLRNNKWNYYHSEAVRALGNLGDTRAVEPLIKALGHGDKGVRKAAAEALGKLGDARAIAPLILCLIDNDEYVRQSTAHALGQLGEPKWESTISEYLSDTISKIGKIEDDQKIILLVKLLGSGHQHEWEYVVSELKDIEDERVVIPLMELLKTEVHIFAKQGDADRVNLLKSAVGILCNYAKKNPKLIFRKWDEISFLINNAHYDHKDHADFSANIKRASQYCSSDCTHSETRHADKNIDITFPDKPKNLDF